VVAKVTILVSQAVQVVAVLKPTLKVFLGQAEAETPAVSIRKPGRAWVQFSEEMEAVAGVVRPVGHLLQAVAVLVTPLKVPRGQGLATILSKR
jgi:hypothetical protein